MSLLAEFIKIEYLIIIMARKTSSDAASLPVTVARFRELASEPLQWTVRRGDR